MGQKEKRKNNDDDDKKVSSKMEPYILYIVFKQEFPFSFPSFLFHLSCL